LWLALYGGGLAPSQQSFFSPDYQIEIGPIGMVRPKEAASMGSMLCVNLVW
jgi:hypothetical protein